MAGKLSGSTVVALFLFASPATCFLRFALVQDVMKAQWQSDAVCKDRRYRGLAVIDTKEKWDYAKVLLDQRNVQSELWIALQYYPGQSAAFWVRMGDYSWGNWGADPPNWGFATCVVITPAGNRIWTTRGCNYDRNILCDFTFDQLKMKLHWNQRVNFTLATPLYTKQDVQSSTDCGMACASVSICTYVTFNSGNMVCVLYDDNLKPLLGSDAGFQNTQLLYAIMIIT